MEELKSWITLNKISAIVDGHKLIIDGFGVALFVDSKEGVLLTNEESKHPSEYYFNLSESEKEELEESEEIKYIVFKWGTRFYYSGLNKSKDEINDIIYLPSFNDLLNIGKYVPEIDIPFVNLGIHTGYELLNGSGEPKDWVNKTKFFKQKSLAINDKNTLGGHLAFQLECVSNDIKPILSATYSIAYDYSDKIDIQTIFDLKLYVKNETGWRNLLRINKDVNVVFGGFIPEENLLGFSEGLICVISKDSYFNRLLNKKNKFKERLGIYKELFDDVYYQIDLNEMSDDSLDMENLNNVKTYIEKFSDILKPIYIPDSYYCESINSGTKKILNKIDKKSEPESDDQYLKDGAQIISDNIGFFEDDEKLDILLDSVKNTVILSDKCNFQIDVTDHKLPKFECEDSEELYQDLIAKGFQEKILSKFDDLDKIDEYVQRVKEENAVIIGAGFVDYFLTQWDIVKWAKDEGILVGPARGSVGGSLVAYLLSITEIDPIKYDLLFERFLNKARVMPDIQYEVKTKEGKVLKFKEGDKIKSKRGKKIIIDRKFDFLRKDIDHNVLSFETFKINRKDALPDIDIDFEGKRRQEVKRYIERKYGLSQVCSVGTYNRLKVRSVIKDFGKAKGLEFQEVNSATKQVPDSIKSHWKDIFDNSFLKPQLKTFVQNNLDICESIKSVMGQARSASVHASAVLILPKEDKFGNIMTVYDWLPVKMVDGVLVSEWEGKYVDRAGFLKEDILGLAQLDKLKSMLNLIKNNRGKKIDLDKIPTDCEAAFKFFKKGWNDDVFQFGTKGLKSYSKKVKPSNIEDLISMNALFRPGPMDSDAHTDFAKIKHGLKKPKFDPFMEGITKKSHGLYVFQEQVMQALVVGGLTLAESDVARTAIKKFDLETLSGFKSKFIKGYGALLKESGEKDPEKRSIEIWDKLLAFSSYGFNKSHAAAYSLIGYWCQWIKVKYPLEFWTASLNFADEKTEVPNRLSEIGAINMESSSPIEVMPPDINKSERAFTSDPKINEIYWSLAKIKFAGDIAVNEIMSCREKDGEFFSLEEFLGRVLKSKVNKRICTNLIISGAFDRVEIEGTGFTIGRSIENRCSYLSYYYNLIKADLPEDLIDNVNTQKSWFWTLKQKEITGFGDVDYKNMILKKTKVKRIIDNFWSGEEFASWKDPLKGERGRFDTGATCTIAGRILSLFEKTDKNGGTYYKVNLGSNNTNIEFMVWSDISDKYGDILKELDSNKNMFAISGGAFFDDFREANSFKINEKTKIIEL